MADDRGWRDALRFVDDVAALAERLVAEETRVAIDSAWPTWTGWSAANNRVVEGQSGSFPLNPTVRPTTAGAIFAEANQALAMDLALIENHKTPGLIAIGNAVPYAADVGFIPNNGTLIYEEATRSGTTAGIRRVGNEWQPLKR